jgi:hypothetical protein
MEKIDIYTTEDAMCDIVINHLTRIKKLDQEMEIDEILSEMDFYSKDMSEVFSEAIKYLSKEDFLQIFKDMRKFNLCIIDILNKEGL